VTYVVVESPNKTLLETFIRCRGMFFGDSKNEFSRIYSKEVLTLSDDKKASERQKLKYQSRLESSYLSIVPVMNPKLPTHITYETYRTVRLSGPSSNPFVVLYHFVQGLYGFFESHSPFQNTWHLYILTGAVVLLFVATLYMILTAVIACTVYQVQTYNYRKRSKLLPQSEFEVRQQPQASDNSLDMTERSAATLQLPEG